MKLLITASMLCLLLFGCGEDRPLPSEHREGLDIQQGLNATRNGGSPPAAGQQNGTGQPQ
jgi:hypothetical protein